jgi:outer membrane protein assembly factor BamB/DNA-binding MarR family transcriptional regulator
MFLFIICLGLFLPSTPIGLLSAHADGDVQTSHDWLFPHHDLGNSASTDVEPLKGTDIAWSKELGPSNVSYSGPLVVGQSVYIGYSPLSPAHGIYLKIFSLNLSSGETYWSDSFKELNGGNISFYNNHNIFVGDQCIYVPYRKETIVNVYGHHHNMGIIALDRFDGTERWNTEFGEYISQPFLTDAGIGLFERIYHDNITEYQYRLIDQYSGSVLETTKLQIFSTFIAGHDNIIYFGLDTKLIAFDLNSLSIVWRSNTQIGSIQELPIVTEDLVIISDYSPIMESHIRAFNRTSGSEIWSINGNEYGRAFAANKEWLATSIAVIRTKNGSLAWTLPKVPLYGFPWINPTISNTVLYEGVVRVGGSSNGTFNLMAFDIRTGEELMNLSFPDGPNPTPIAAVDGRLVFAAGAHIYCIGIGNVTYMKQDILVRLDNPLRWRMPPPVTWGNYSITGVVSDINKSNNISTIRVKIIQMKSQRKVYDETKRVDPPVSEKRVTWVLDTTLLENSDLSAGYDFYLVYLYAYDAKGNFGRDWGNISVYNTYINPLSPPPTLAINVKTGEDGTIEAQAGQKISFSAPSYTDFPSNDTTCYWFFGDGAKDQHRATEHIYNSTGKYDLDLIMDNGERTITIHTKVDVKPPQNNGNEPSTTVASKNAMILSTLSISIIVLVSFVAFANTEVGKYGIIPPLMGLYTRIRKVEVLDHYTRGRIMGYLQSNPGVNYNSIKDELSLNNGTLTYHLQVMEREGFIKSQRIGLHKRFYPINAKREDEVSLEELVLANLRKNPGISQKDLAFRLGENPTTIHRILHKLSKAEIVSMQREGKITHCYLKRDEGNDSVSGKS